MKRIRRYFSEPKGVHAQNSLGSTDLRNLWDVSQYSWLSHSSSCVLCIWLRCRYSWVFMHVRTGERLVSNLMPITLQTSLRRTFHFCVQGKKLLFYPEGRGSIFLRRYLCTRVYVSTSQKTCATVIICRINSGQSRQVAWRKTWKSFFFFPQNEAVSVEYQGAWGYVMKVSQFLIFVIVIVFFGRR